MSAVKYDPDSTDWLSGVRVGGQVHFRAKGSAAANSEIAMELYSFRFKAKGAHVNTAIGVGQGGTFLTDSMAAHNIAADDVELHLVFKGTSAGMASDWGRQSATPVMFGMQGDEGFWIRGNINVGTDDNMGMTTAAQPANLFSTLGWLDTSAAWPWRGRCG